MKVSLNWIRKLTDVNIGLSQLEEVIGARLGAIDEVVDLGAKYKDVYVVRVMNVLKHPNADRLHVCLVDDGNENREVPRNEHGFVQVVCGAPNVKEGMLAVWLPPGATVPVTHGTADPLTLMSRSMRGADSHGMLASPQELGLGDSHEGILEVDEPARAGELFADTYELNDFIIDIENKMFTHRPDLFGMLGIARELAGITGQAFHSPDWYREFEENPLQQEARPLPLVINNEVSGLVPHFMAIILANVKLRTSPVLFQSYLLRVGIRPVNNVVDVTNYMMLLTGQPLHAYDYDKIKALDSADTGQVTLTVRRPREKETITLLGGKTITPRPESILISTAQHPVGLGGIMGGNNAEVDERTQNIILECATFDMFNLRRTSMAHGIFTDASTRFTKGQSPLQNEYIFVKAVEVMKGMAGGQIASSVYDDRHFDGIIASNDTVHQPVKITVDFINARLGTALTEVDITTLLTNVEFAVQQITAGQILVTAPFWRTDIEHPEDIVEEVGRLYGFDKVPARLPLRSLAPTTPAKQFELRHQVRQSLSRLGANEVLTYSFASTALLTRSGQDSAQAWQLANALSPALQCYRLSVLPSLLEKVRPNVKAGHQEFGLFEIGKSHHKAKLDADGLPAENESLAFLFAATPKAVKGRYEGAAFYQARAFLDQVLKQFNLTKSVRLEPITAADLKDDAWLKQLAAPFELTRSVALNAEDGKTYGILGEFTAEVCQNFKLPAFAAGFELNPELLQHNSPQPVYTPLPRFPSVEQDITFSAEAGMPYQKLAGVVHHQVDKHRPKHAIATVMPLDIYQSDTDKTHKHFSFRITITSTERTLTDKEVALVLDRVAAATKDELHVERV